MVVVGAAWAGDPATQARHPVLVVEDVAVPEAEMPPTYQSDLLYLLEAHAWQQGLAGCVARCFLPHRRYREGTPVALAAADPAQFALYCHTGYAAVPQPEGRWLAPFNPAHDALRPQNAVAADWILSQPRASLQWLGEDEHGQPIAFMVGQAGRPSPGAGREPT